MVGWFKIRTFFDGRPIKNNDQSSRKNNSGVYTFKNVAQFPFRCFCSSNWSGSVAGRLSLIYGIEEKSLKNWWKLKEIRSGLMKRKKSDRQSSSRYLCLRSYHLDVCANIFLSFGGLEGEKNDQSHSLSLGLKFFQNYCNYYFVFVQNNCPNSFFID